MAIVTVEVERNKPAPASVEAIPALFDCSLHDTPLRRMRCQRRMTQQEFGRQFGLSQAHVSRMEGVVRPYPCGPELATKLVNFFGVLWCGPEKELLFMYPDRYRGVPLPFEYVAAQPKP